MKQIPTPDKNVLDVVWEYSFEKRTIEDMNRAAQSRKTLVRGVVIFLIGIASCALLYLVDRIFLVHKYDDGTGVETQAIEQVLELALTHPTGIFPQKDLNPRSQRVFMQYFMNEGSECWSAIQNGMTKNKNKYVFAGSNHFRLLPDGNIENVGDVGYSFVLVRFPNDTQVVFGFYQKRIVECFIDLSHEKKGAIQTR